MISYIIRRLLIAVPVLFGISLISFFLVRLVPGDTVTALLGMNYTEEQAALLREKYGLDRPLILQYVIWLFNVLQGDFGYSSFANKPVLAAIIERLPVTLELTVCSVLFALFIAIPLGTIASIRRNGIADYSVSFLGMLGISVPNFWLGTMMILLFSLHLGWLPSGDFVPLTESVWGNVKSMLMPAVALGWP